MRTNSEHKLVDSYLELLKSLSHDNKLELISRLSDSFKGSQKKDNKSLHDLFGGFLSDESADDIISTLKKSIHINCNTEAP
jgi:hypothetical protein